MRFLAALLLVPLLAGCAAPGGTDDAEGVSAAAADVDASDPADGVDPDLPIHVEGASSVSTAACLPTVEACFLVAGDWGTFDVASAAPAGALMLEWAPPPNAMGLRVYLIGPEGDVAAAVGDSPITMDVPPLGMGRYEVRVFPDLAVGPADITVAWTFDA